MNDEREKEIVDFVVSELFAPDGPLQLRHNVHLKPYHKQWIRRWVRGRTKDELGIEFTDEECKLESEDEYLNNVVNAIKDSL